MRKQLGALLLALLTLGCAGPDPERDGFVLVDPVAAAAGIELEIDGERLSGRLPLAVPEGAEASIVRPSGIQPFQVTAGELVEIVGRDGEMHRRDVPRDQVWVEGEAASVSAFAEMIGAHATPLPNGGWAVSGPDAFVLASLIGDLAEVNAISRPPSRTPGVVDVGVFLGPRANVPAPESDSSTTPNRGGPTPDAAALVGLYTHGTVSLLLDAAGEYSVFGVDLAQPVVTGTYRPRPGGVDFIPNDGGPRAVMELEGEQLVDDLGIGFEAVEGQL